MTGPVAGRPDAAAERVDGVGAPVQADAVVGFRGLGGEAFLEDALRGAAAAMPTPSSRHCRCSCCTSSSRTISALRRNTPLLLAGIAHGVGGVDDEVLQDQPQHRARHAHHPEAPQRLVGVDRKRCRQASGTISSDCDTSSVRRTGSITCSLRVERICSASVVCTRVVWRVITATSSCAQAHRGGEFLGRPAAGTPRGRRCVLHRPLRPAVPPRPGRHPLRAPRAAAPPRFARRTPIGVMALPRLCSTPLASSAKPAWKD